MRKNNIALAVAAFASCAAMAQSNVQIYGIVDAGVAHIEADGKHSTNKVESGMLRTSRFGFKGTEDLGDGLKAVFVLEYRLNVDSNQTIGGSFTTDANGVQGSASGPARQQYVGLASNLGTVVAGRINTTAFDWAVKYTVLGASIFDVTGNNAMAAGSRVNPLADIRASNAVAYKSPTFYGARLDVNYARPIEQAASGDGRVNMWQVGGYYDNGPLSVGAVYDAVKGDGTAALTLSSLNFARGAGFPVPATSIAYDTLDIKSLNIGGSYDFGLAKLKATYQGDKFNTLARNKVWGVGTEIPVFAKGTVHLVYSKSVVNTLANADSSGFSLAYTHDLSKRTIAYVGYSRQSNDAAGTAGNWQASPVAGGNVTTVAAGLTHMF
jgi:predicted porin